MQLCHYSLPIRTLEVGFMQLCFHPEWGLFSTLVPCGNIQVSISTFVTCRNILFFYLNAIYQAKPLSLLASSLRIPYWLSGSAILIHRSMSGTSSSSVLVFFWCAAAICCFIFGLTGVTEAQAPSAQPSPAPTSQPQATTDPSEGFQASLSSMHIYI